MSESADYVRELSKARHILKSIDFGVDLVVYYCATKFIGGIQSLDATLQANG